MKDKATKLSIIVKIAGCIIILGGLILNGFQIWVNSIDDVIKAAMGMQLFVLSIDISKIKEAGK